MVQQRNQGSTVLAKVQIGEASGLPITEVRRYQATINPASVAANVCAEQTFTVTGLAVGDIVVVNSSAPLAGMGICGVRVSAVNTLAVNFVNPTAGALDQASGTWDILAFRPA